ncbi:MAG TPA: methyltransferase domain-containing protein [Pseudonocardiaceae bacterium]|nr:methyltransferase domain-containing protein [Pseudonocardiaceae bacterium]
MRLDQVAAQRGYHRALYQALWDWSAAEQVIGRNRLRGMDLLGHFGAAGCDLVVAAIGDNAPDRPLRLAEFGSGIGGVLRYVLGALDDRDIPVDLAIGCDLVVEHGRVAREIGTPRCFPVGTSVSEVGIRSATLDIVFATGAVSHFADMAATLAEAHRILRPGGLLTFTEEVSLVGPAGEPSAEFRESHPSDVFATATPLQRRTQLADAGFIEVAMRDLGDWAATLLHRRLLALRVQRAAVAEVYGADETASIVATLAAARAEIVAGRLAPAHVVAFAG